MMNNLDLHISQVESKQAKDLAITRLCDDPYHKAIQRTALIVTLMGGGDLYYYGSGTESCWWAFKGETASLSIPFKKQVPSVGVYAIDEQDVSEPELFGIPKYDQERNLFSVRDAETLTTYTWHVEDVVIEASRVVYLKGPIYVI